MSEEKLIVTISLTFPMLDRKALADHIAPILREAVAAGGSYTSISVMPDTEEEETT